METRWRRLILANGIAFGVWLLTPVYTLCLDYRPANDWEWLAPWVMYRPVEAITTLAVLVCLGYDLGYGVLALRRWRRRRARSAFIGEARR